MEYRQLARDGVCSLCYGKIKRNTEKVITNRSWKHHKLVVICDNCITEINYEKGEK